MPIFLDEVDAARGLTDECVEIGVAEDLGAKDIFQPFRCGLCSPVPAMGNIVCSASVVMGLDRDVDAGGDPCHALGEREGYSVVSGIQVELPDVRKEPLQHLRLDMQTDA